MKIVTMKMADLHMTEKNIRRHTEKQLKEYIRSVKMFDQMKPLVVTEDGEILIGNGLFMAMQQMGRTEIDCYVVKGLTDAEKKKLMLADNRVYELGITDTDALDDIIRSLDGDIDVPGWDEDLLETLNASLEDVDAMVNDYGNFSSHDVNRVNEKSQVQQQPTQEAPQNPVNLSPNTAFTPSGQIDPAVSPEAPQNANEAEIQRYVICPKCGERICL